MVAHLWRVWGPADPLAAMRAWVQAPPRAPLVSQEIVDEGPRHLRILSRMREPEPRDPRDLVTFLAALGWGRLIQEIWLRDGTLTVSLLGQDPSRLGAVVQDLRSSFSGALSFDLIRCGPPDRRRWDPAGTIEPDEEELVAAALGSGYYQEPKGCGVRELAHDLGLSRTSVSRKLRSLERRGLELLRAQGRWDMSRER